MSHTAKSSAGGPGWRALALATTLTGVLFAARAVAADVTAGAAAPSSGVAAGFVPLDSADQLKAYYFVFTRTPADRAEFTRYALNLGQAAVQAADDLADKAVERAKADADIILDLKDVSLNNYDASKQAFPMDNRLFLGKLGYYFDDSPYHYFYTNPSNLNPLPCPDPAVARTIDERVNAYKLFEMKVYGRVTGADATDKSVAVKIAKIELFDDGGHLLFERNAGE